MNIDFIKPNHKRDLSASGKKVPNPKKVDIPIIPPEEVYMMKSLLLACSQLLNP